MEDETQSVQEKLTSIAPADKLARQRVFSALLRQIAAQVRSAN